MFSEALKLVLVPHWNTAVNAFVREMYLYFLSFFITIGLFLASIIIRLMTKQLVCMKAENYQAYLMTKIDIFIFLQNMTQHI